MNIIIINKEREIINARNLSIKVINSCLVGINERQETMVIERYESEDRAKEILNIIGKKIIKFRNETGIPNYIVIDLEIEESLIKMKEMEKDKNGES